ncbi:hypothetical protein SKAU_G00348400 [Synaphobranchus kaupii]|uniref:Uncharacterized protein n=1 Tax=Synaphobranchus kaupii TaxID=118154 RepID=A0A9Q1EJZ8_SYNKA|nr:hypothetical protein SKAU_G00348400 [Synaphobranchus kaupii]
MDAQSVYTSLVRGIEEFNFDHTHIPSRLLLSCEGAVPVAVSPSGHVLIAAAQYGKGRVVVMSHEAYIKYELALFGPFVQNAIDWLKPHPDASVGVYELSNLRKFLVERGMKAKDVPSYDSTVEVLCCSAKKITQAEEVLQFVKGGGGLLIAGQAWHWSYSNSNLLSYPGNKVIRTTGIVFSSEIADRGVYKVPKKIPSSLITDVPVRSRMDAQSVYTSLVRGIEEFNFNYDHEPSRLLLTCEEAVPVAVSPSGHVLIAAVQYGKGRVIAMGHASYIQYELDDFERFVQNAIDWLKPHPDASVGVYKLSNLAKFLVERGIKAFDVPHYDRAVEVFCCNVHKITQAEEVLQFVKGGGGLLIAGHAWHWSSKNPKKESFLSYPGNKVIRATGIVFSSETAERGVHKVPKEIPSTSGFQP